MLLRRLRPRRRQRRPRLAVLHRRRRRPVAAPRHRRLDEHLGPGQAGDRAGPRLLPGRRQRARDRLRPRLRRRGRPDRLSRRALRRARHAVPRVVRRHAHGDGDDAHGRLRSSAIEAAELGLGEPAPSPPTSSSERVVDGRRRASRRSRPTSCSSTSARCTAPWRSWACATPSAPAPSCARSAIHQASFHEFIDGMRTKGLTKALQERDEPFGDYRTTEPH